MINLQEILVANGIAALMMWFLLVSRRKNRESIHKENRIFDGMVFANMMGAVLETIGFLLDGKLFFCGRVLNYLINSLCYLGTVTIGFQWCVYVDIHIYRSYRRTKWKLKLLVLPWLIELLAIMANLFGTEIIFRISAENVYERSPGAVIGYITLMIYFVYSTYLVYHSKRQGINLSFFPVLYFVVPCAAGVVIQLLCYGITTSWIMVAVALMFVQLQSYAENLYMDALSGLYNRRYFDSMMAARRKAGMGALYGIMMDINDFKGINDALGHSMGDQAICTMGEILMRSIPDGGVAIRYAGDEFVVLLPVSSVVGVFGTMQEIRNHLAEFNAGGTPFQLSVAMGHARFELDDTPECFLNRMDSRMYEEKRKYHKK